MAASERTVTVITGASGGIGAAVACLLAKENHALVLAARRWDELGRVARDCGANALPVRTDVTERAQVERLRDEALRAFGRVDVWINNAGRGISKPVLELTDADVDEMVTVNVKSALYGMQAIIPHFQKRGRGHLINVSSFLGRVPMASIRSVYSASKAMLNSLTTNLRMDLRERWPNVHVSTVMPGIVATDFAANARGTGDAPPRPTNAPMEAQPVDDAARRIVELIHHPVPEIYTNPALPGIARKFFDDVRAFEAVE